MKRMSKLGKSRALTVPVFVLAFAAGNLLQADTALFEDDFEDGNAAEWIEDNPSVWSVVDGEYKIEHSGVDFTAQTHVGDGSWTDYRFEADVICDSGWCDASLHFRVQSTGSQQPSVPDGEYYRFIVSPTSNESVLQLFSGGSITVLTGNNTFLRDHGEWFKMTVEVEGSEIRCYVDDTLVIQFVDATFASGYVGLDMFSYTQSRFDNVRVSRLTGPPLECVGFDPPMHAGPVTVRGKHKSLPLMAKLFDGEDIEITGDDLVAPPVVEFSFTSASSDATTDISDDALPASWSTDGNQFEYVWGAGKWQYNVRNWDFSAPGTYTFRMKSGDDPEYIVEPTCEAEFVIR